MPISSNIGVRSGSSLRFAMKPIRALSGDQARLP